MSLQPHLEDIKINCSNSLKGQEIHFFNIGEINGYYFGQKLIYHHLYNNYLFIFIQSVSYQRILVFQFSYRHMNKFLRLILFVKTFGLSIKVKSI